MALRLVPCASCSRHVRVDENACPFCGRELGDAVLRAPAPRMPESRLGRAARFAFGAAVATTIATTGCSDRDDGGSGGGTDSGMTADSGGDTDGGGTTTDGGGTTTDGGGTTDDAGATDDAGTMDDGGMMALYGGPPDAGPQDGGSMGLDEGGVMPLYGAPPEPSA